MQYKKTIWILAVGLICALLFSGCAASRFLSYKSDPDYPKDETKNLDIPGLQAPVTVVIDKAGVAHIDAQNEPDLLRATGFVQARHRFFAMDMMRRMARGRLSELIGEQPVLDATSVQFDLSMRGWGFDEAAVEDEKNVDEPTRALLQAYVDGINHARELYNPLEYRLLGATSEPWTIADTFALGRLIGWSVTHNYHQEMSRLFLALNVGIDRASKIYGHDYWDGDTSLPDKEITQELLPPIAPELRELFPERPYKDWSKEKVAWTGWGHDLVKKTGASNGWAVAGNLTKSGKPLVASDPHLAHMLPSLFYQQHLRLPDLNVIGITVAGLPYVLIGHNDHVAWAMTSAVADVIDLYVEKLNPDNPTQVLTPDGYQDLTIEKQIIKVRDGSDMESREFTLRRTRHGPILNDMFPKKFPEWSPPISLQWNMEGASRGILALAKANRAKTVQELRETMLGITVPSSMYLAADDSGQIAIFASGVFPIRKKHRGTFPVPGWLAEYDWEGFVDPMQNTYGVKTEGFYAHGNNLMIRPDHNDIFIQIDSAPSYRMDRIAELLRTSDKHDMQSMATIQTDVKLKRAERLMPFFKESLLSATDLTDEEKKARELLFTWDFNAKADSGATALFFLTYREAAILALHDELDPKGFEFLLSQRYSTNVADTWFETNSHVVWDDRGTPETELRNPQVIKAFKKAVASLHDQQGSDPATWSWGALHDLCIKHPFGGKKAIAGFVNLPCVPVGGGMDSVWKSHFDLGHPKTPFRAMAGPAYRHVVDLNDMNHAWWISDTGTSGWPAHPHYGDQHKLWLLGEYQPMLTNFDELLKDNEAVLTLQPPASAATPEAVNTPAVAAPVPTAPAPKAPVVEAPAPAAPATEAPAVEAPAPAAPATEAPAEETK